MRRKRNKRNKELYEKLILKEEENKLKENEKEK